MADPISKDGRSNTRCSIPAKIFRVFHLRDLVIDREVPNVTASVRTRDLLKGNSSALKTFEDHLEELPLLWIHILGFHIIDSEETVLEITYIFVDKVTAYRIETTRPLSAVWMVEAIDIESRLWNLPLAGPAIG